MEGDLVGRTDGSRRPPGAGLQERIDEERRNPIEGDLIELTGDVHHIGDLNARRKRETELGGARLDGGGSGICLDAADREAVPLCHTPTIGAWQRQPAGG